MNIQKIAQNYSVAKSTGVTVIDGKKGERKEIYIRTNANGFGAGRKDLVTAATVKATGITNLENADMLPNGKDYLVQGLKIAYAPATDAAVATANYGTHAGLPQFINGEIRIEQDGLLLNLPIKAVSVSVANDGSVLEGEQYYEVLPFMIKQGKTFSISVEPVGAIAVDMCFDLSLDVVEISTSAKVSARN